MCVVHYRNWHIRRNQIKLRDTLHCIVLDAAPLPTRRRLYDTSAAAREFIERAAQMRRAGIFMYMFLYTWMCNILFIHDTWSIYGIVCVCTRTLYCEDCKVYFFCHRTRLMFFKSLIVCNVLWSFVCVCVCVV